MKSALEIIALRNALSDMVLRERDNTKKKVLRSYALVLEYVLDDKMTLEDLERVMKDAMR